jgi:hypothetical protein
MINFVLTNNWCLRILWLLMLAIDVICLILVLPAIPFLIYIWILKWISDGSAKHRAYYQMLIF